MSTVDVMQGTGKVDCMGKEIYEGDIVEFMNYEPAAVFWSNERNCWMTQFPNQLPELGAFFPEDLEIVGNIWENPEELGLE